MHKVIYRASALTEPCDTLREATDCFPMHPMISLCLNEAMNCRKKNTNCFCPAWISANDNFEQWTGSEHQDQIVSKHLHEM